MIFVTVGVQLPFDRLVQAVDAWAETSGRRDIEAQIGNSAYECRYINARPYCTPTEFMDLVKAADILVAHAGMGSIITALELGKPIIVMPRQASLLEHRNDHQLATARRLSSHGLIRVAQTAEALSTLLDESPSLSPSRCISAEANAELIESLKSIIAERPRRSVISQMFAAKRAANGVDASE